MSWFPGHTIWAVTNDTEAEAVRYFQRIFNLPGSGELDADTKAKLRGIQVLFGLQVTGMLNAETAAQIDHIYPEGA